MTADPFIRAASDRALSIAMETFKPGFDPENHPSVYRLLVDMAEWARAHLAAQEPTDAEWKRNEVALNPHSEECRRLKHLPADTSVVDAFTRRGPRRSAPARRDEETQ